MKGKKGKVKKSKPKGAGTQFESGKASPTDSDINRCNEAFWRRNCKEEASFIFENNKLMGFSWENDKAFLVSKLIELEEKDREKMQEEQGMKLGKRSQGKDVEDKNFGWVNSGSRGASGGLITMWRSSLFTLNDQWSTQGALAVKGLWIEEKVSFCLINIYASNITQDQQKVWDDTQQWLCNQSEKFSRICGDFNTILDLSERKGTGKYFDAKRSRQFRRFISNPDLVDLPLLRRKFTWYKDNDGCCSRIDRFLLSSAWCKRWPNVKQTSLKRTFSDHAPILLEVTEKENWGTVPFKIVNWWLDQEEFCNLVERVWKDTSVDGWGGFFLKEKLKRLKTEIKAWKAKNRIVFSKEIEEREQQLDVLDDKLETGEWDEVDRNNRRT
ncbi:hypothetical protein ACS0TY_007123 [Phlomoides rotata]